MAKAASKPITHHPLFPAVVALWFAALVGIGSYALRTALIEQLIVAAHIDEFVPAATPPLGSTARLLVALGFGAIGAVAGWLLALRVANPRQTPTPTVLNVADLDDPFSAPRPAAVEKPMPVFAPASHDLPAEETPAPAVEAPEPEPEPEAPVVTAAQRIAQADLACLSHVELIERLAIAINRRDELRDAKAAPAASEPPSFIVQLREIAERHNGPQNPPLSLPAAPARPAPEETERALRDALTRLQRMSGNG